MYKEVCEKKRGAFFGILTIITAGFCLLSLPAWIEHYLPQSPMPFPYLYEAAMLIATVVLLYFYARSSLTGFVYCVIDNELIIYKVVGKRRSNAIKVHLSSIKDFARGECNSEVGALRLYNKHKNGKTAYITYSDTKQRAIVFAPSDTLFTIISEKMLDKR